VSRLDNKSPTRRIVGVVLCLILGFALSPAANAQFSGTRAAATSFSTAVLVAPSVTPQCAKVQGDYRFTITVPAIDSVNYASYLELRVKNASQYEVFRGNASALPNRTFSASTRVNSGEHTWTYELRAVYAIPNSNSKQWVSQPVSGTYVCK
jgi:hypothetical protein